MVTLSEEEGPQLFKGRFKSIDIMTTKQNNKLVTWVTGLQTFIRSKNKEEELAEFCHDLSVRFACGAAYA
jgi:translation initiation factor 1 (eIF-1/SUI1)